MNRRPNPLAQVLFEKELVPYWQDVGANIWCASPCGGLAGREQCHQMAGPGGAAVALAENNLEL